MKKGYKINPKSIDLILGGAKQLLVPICGTIRFFYYKKDVIDLIIENIGDTHFSNTGFFSSEDKALSYFIGRHSPFKIGDVIYAQEEFCEDELEVYYKSLCSEECATNTIWEDSSKMKERQSRLKNITIIGVEVKRLHSLSVSELLELGYKRAEEAIIGCNDAKKDHGVDEDANPYAFLFTIEVNCNE